MMSITTDPYASLSKDTAMPIPAGLTVPQLMWLLLLGQLYGSYHHVAPPHAAVAPSPHACRWAVGLVLAALMGTATPARMSASAPRRETSTTLQEIGRAHV